MLRPFSTANAQLSLTPKFFLMTYQLSPIASDKGTLTIVLPIAIKLSELNYEYLRPFEEQRVMHFFCRVKESSSFMAVFQGDNETVPYDCLAGVSSESHSNYRARIGWEDMFRALKSKS